MNTDLRRGRPGLMSAAFVLAIVPGLRADSGGASPGPEPAPSPTPSPAPVQAASDNKTPPRLDVYGFAMLDMGYQTKQNDPDWFDVVRPVKLPAFENQFGEDGHFFAGEYIRQTAALGGRSAEDADWIYLQGTLTF